MTTPVYVPKENIKEVFPIVQDAIDKALKMSSNLSELWASGDLPQKKKIQSLVFPSGIGYDKLKGKVQTKRINSIFSSIPSLSRGLAKIKSGESVDLNQFSARVTSGGRSSNFLIEDIGLILKQEME